MYPEIPELLTESVVKRVRPSYPKRKVAIMMGYCGTGYQGMQMNPNARTIEKELFEALCAEKLLLDDNMADPKKNSWMRSCRTDKGVHACSQVVSVKILLKNDYEGMEDKNDEVTACKFIARALNDRLPDQIRVFDVKKVTNGFHAKEQTDSRIYEYLMPTYVFQPTDPEPYTKDPAPRPTVHIPSLEWSPENNEIPAEDLAAIRAYRISVDSLDSIREYFKSYIGRHKFHNFTTEYRTRR